MFRNLFCCLTAFLSTNLLTVADELPVEHHDPLSATVESRVRRELCDLRIAESETNKHDVYLFGRRVGSVRETRKLTLQPDVESFRLSFTKPEIIDGRLCLQLESLCDVSGDAHASTCGPGIPVSVTSGFSTTFSVKARLEADFSLSGTSLSLSKPSVTNLQINFTEVRWTNTRVDIFRTWIDDALRRALHAKQAAARDKINLYLAEAVPQSIGLDMLSGLSKGK